MLLIYKPWHYQSQIAQSSDWIAEFNKFVNSNDAPESLKCAYKAVKQRKETKNKLQKNTPIAQEPTIRDDEIPSDDEALLTLTGKHGSESQNE